MADTVDVQFDNEDDPRGYVIYRIPASVYHENITEGQCDELVAPQ